MTTMTTNAQELGTSGAVAVTRLESARAALKAATAAEKAAKAAVLNALAGATTGTVEGVTVVEVVTIHVDRLDTKALAVDLPDVATAYTRDTAYDKVVIV